MSCAESLTADQRSTLLTTARASIAHGRAEGQPMTVTAAEFEEPLRQDRACFVTLREPDGELRGCMGSSQPIRPLIDDVARNAFSAAFLDPRFQALQAHEADGLHLHLSVLTPLEELTVASEQDLLDQVRPGIDGLLMEEGLRRGTLLPAVWEALPEPSRFLHALRRKADLPGDYWSPTLRIFRYTAESFE